MRGFYDIMRLAIILTLTYTGERDDEGDSQGIALLTDFTEKYIIYAKKQYEDNGYTIIRTGVGIHRDATRLHSHIGTIIDIDPSQNVKHWNKKLTSILKINNSLFELRRTPYRDDDPLFDEMKCIAYCLKEYSAFENVEMLKSFMNMTDEEIEKHREYGNDHYIKAKAEKERNAMRKKLEEDEGENIAQYIRDYIAPKNRKRDYMKDTQFEALGFTGRYKFVKVAILCYYQQRYEDTGRRNFKAYSVRDKAISFMISEKLCSFEDVADFLN